jgi:hypothetical protein
MPNETEPRHFDFGKLIAVAAVFAVMLGLTVGVCIVVLPQLVHSRTQRDDEQFDDRPVRPDRDVSDDAESGARAAKLGLSSMSNPFHQSDRRAAEWLSGYMRQRERGGWGSTAPATAKDPNAK